MSEQIYWSKRQRRLPLVLDAIRKAMEVDAPDFGTAEYMAEIVSEQLALKSKLSARTILRDIEFLNTCGARIVYERRADCRFAPGYHGTYRLTDPEWGLDATTKPADYLEALNAAISICRASGKDETADTLTKLEAFLMAQRTKT